MTLWRPGWAKIYSRVVAERGYFMDGHRRNRTLRVSGEPVRCKNYVSVPIGRPKLRNILGRFAGSSDSFAGAQSMKMWRFRTEYQQLLKSHSA